MVLAVRKANENESGLLSFNHEAVALDSGTSCVRRARAFAGRRLTVMPFSLQATMELFGEPSIDLITPGGAVNAEEGSIVGPLAEASVRALRFDTAIISPCGALPADGATAHDIQDASVKRAIISAARRTILVAGGSKFCALRWPQCAPFQHSMFWLRIGRLHLESSSNCARKTWK
ncbi:hypothetical protein ACLKOZ_20355 [Arthrobacter sp. R4]|uniref:hypothetical protein n=1 Tax=Arthrobacter sp. R4 TaxID=644417 RepID=UPI003ED9F9B3